MSYTKPGELKNKITGINVVMVTPFDRDENLNINGIKEITNYLIESGIRNGSGVLYPVGSTGECFAMTPEERKKVARAVIREAEGRVPVVVGCNENNTRTVIDLAQDAQKAGADGVMIMTPYYGSPSNEQIIDFFKKIASNIDIWDSIVFKSFCISRYSFRSSP